MQVILQGSLRHFPAAELLGFLCHPGRKGTLDLEVSGRRTRILFENETILGAQSKTAGEGVDAVLDALEWTDGTFTLLDAAVLPDGAKPLALTVPALHQEAKRRAEEKAAGYPDATYFHVVEDPALQQQVSLKAEEFKLLFRLAAGRTFSELLAEYAIPRRELADRLRYLEGLGLIKSESAAERSTPWAPEASAAPPKAEPKREEPPVEAPRSEPPPVAPPKAAPPQAEPARVEPRREVPSRSQEMATVPESVPVPDVPEAERTMMQAPPAPVPPETSAAAAPRRPTLVGSLTPDEQPDNVFPLLDAECLIGRRATKEVAFALNDGSISSKHAKLVRTPEGFLIEDLDSKNGTFVNGEKVNEKRLLSDGDLIRLGKVILTFNVAREKKAGDQTIPEIRVE
ncbi:MAG: FHA domain-containing protein [Acidobacteriota bacterium]